MAVMTAIAIGSALVSAYGQYKSSQAQADAAAQQAQIGFMRAEEILARNEINNELLRESALLTAGTQKAQIAASGVDIGGESQRQLVEETFDRAAKQIALNTRTAEWEARMARLGADSGLKSSEEIRTAGTIQSLSTAGFGTLKAAQSSPGSED